MIIAPSATVSAWHNESARLLAVSKTSGLAPEIVEALYHASGILLASAVNATPGGPEAFVAGLKRLVDEVVVEQKTGRVPGATCPLPEDDGSAYVCECGPAGQRKCARIVSAPGRVAVAAGDNGCEGGCSA